MNATRKRDSDADGKPAPAVTTTAGRRSLVIDVHGTVPRVPRSEIRRWSRTILRRLNRPRAELSLAFVTDPTIRELNRRYRNRDAPTDVLSFPLADEVCPDLLGDVVISVDTLRRQARQRKRSVADELLRLLIHGILHLLGYDHEVSPAEAQRMRRMEREMKAAVRGVDAAGSRRSA